MGRIICDELVLSAKESGNLINSLVHPDMRAIELRNQLLHSLESLCIKNDADMPSFEIPDFSIPFSRKIIYSSEKIQKSKDDICKESGFSVNISYSRNFEFSQLEFDCNDGYYLQKSGDTQFTDTLLSFGFAA